MELQGWNCNFGNSGGGIWLAGRTKVKSRKIWGQEEDNY